MNEGRSDQSLELIDNEWTVSVKKRWNLMAYPNAAEFFTFIQIARGTSDSRPLGKHSLTTTALIHLIKEIQV